jgi:hypothetical protein
MRTLLLTRVCIDDLFIFKIWLDYHRPYFSEIACCVFKRPSEDISPIISYLQYKSIKFIVHENEIFDNPTTLETIRLLAEENPADVTIHIDCDEFFDDIFAIEDAASLCFSTGDAIHIEMVDRESPTGELYDISDCTSYRDLCTIAPVTSNITKSEQEWSNFKSAFHKGSKVGRIHYSENGEKSINVRYLKLNHFKWRLDWIKKAKRRYGEASLLGHPWAKGILSMLKKYEK